jgi:hypothetical protein
MMLLGLQSTSSWEYSLGLSIQVCRYLAVEVLWMRHCCWVFRALVAIVPCGRIGPSLDYVLAFCFGVFFFRGDVRSVVFLRFSMLLSTPSD